MEEKKKSTWNGAKDTAKEGERVISILETRGSNTYRDISMGRMLKCVPRCHSSQ